MMEDYDGDGGRSDQRDVMNYRPPTGPTNIGDAKSPGLHGDNCGKQGAQGPYYEHKQSSGRPGLGGTNHGTACYQGKH